MDLDFEWNPWYDLAVLGFDAICAGVLYGVYRKKERLIKNILDAPALSVGSELKEFLNGSPEGSIPYVVVRGKVADVGQVIESSSGLKTVMQRVTLNEHSYRRSALNHWGDNVKTIHQSHNFVPFALRSVHNQNSSSYSAKSLMVHIEHPFNADDESLFLTTSTNFTPSNSSISSTVMGFFTGVAVRGVERTEEVLPVDTIVTGIGRLIQDPHGIKLVSPADDDQYRFILSTLPAESIIKKLEGRNTVLKVALFFVVSVGTFVAIRRLRILWKEAKLRRMRDIILRQRSQIDTEGLSAIQICNVCLTNPKEVILLNCGHVCVCADCVLKLNSKCPVCRSHIVGTHPAYIG